MSALSIVVRGVDSAMALVAPGGVTKTLAIPANTLVNQAVIGAAFTLPEAAGYVFDIKNAGTLDEAGHTTRLDILLQYLMFDGVTWQDQYYFLPANQAVGRAVITFNGQLGPVTSAALSSSGLITSSGGSGNSLIRDTSKSTNAVSVAETLQSFTQDANNPIGCRTFRIVGIPRTATPTTGDTISLSVTALVDPEHGV